MGPNGSEWVCTRLKLRQPCDNVEKLVKTNIAKSFAIIFTTILVTAQYVLIHDSSRVDGEGKTPLQHAFEHDQGSVLPFPGAQLLQKMKRELLRP